MRSLAALLTMLTICGGLMLFAAKLYMVEQRKSLVRGPKAPTQDTARYLRMADSIVSQLRNGDVVLCMGTSVFSQALSGINKRDRSYSHCGIVLVENGRPYVYHCQAGSDTTRCIRREPAKRFLSPLYNTAAAVVRYPFSDTVLVALGNAVRNYVGRKPLFDTHFDLRTDDQLYCSEFVYKVIIQATADSAYLPVSHIPAGVFIGTDDLFLNPHARLVGQVRYY